MPQPAYQLQPLPPGTAAFTAKPTLPPDNRRGGDHSNIHKHPNTKLHSNSTNNNEWSANCSHNNSHTRLQSSTLDTEPHVTLHLTPRTRGHSGFKPDQHTSDDGGGTTVP